METHKPVSAMIDAPKTSPLILVLAVVAFAILVAAAFYLGLQKTAIQDEQKRLDADIVSLQGEIDALKSQNIEAAQLAGQFLESLKGREILWSGVIDRVNTLLPVDVAQKPKINILSYSGAEGGRITLNVVTEPQQIEPFENVAEMVAVFNSSSFFKNAYVPAISRGENDDGTKFLSFVFNVNYQEEQPLLSDSTETAADSEEKAKVSR